jgi:hypothetical protein
VPLLELKSILLERKATLIDLKDTLSFIVDEEASGRWIPNHSNSTTATTSNSALLEEVNSSEMNIINMNVTGNPAYGDDDDDVNSKNIITSSNFNEGHDGTTTITTTTTTTNTNTSTTLPYLIYIYIHF